MTEILQLKSLFPEYSLSTEQNIMFHKAFSNGESSAKKIIKPQACLVCNSTRKSFCNSHSIPARCLRAIAENGNVKVFNGLIKIPTVGDYKGVNAAGTFRLICKECDDKIFKEYETFEKYPDKNPPDKLLHEIALKNYLKYYYKKSIEEQAFPKMLENLGMPNSHFLDFILKTGNRDKKDTFRSICDTKKLLSSTTNGYYRIIEYRKLPYKCPVAFQSVISLITGFDGEIINDVFNMDKNYKIQDMHICILPENDYTYVIFFFKNHFTRYSKFVKHYIHLNDEEGLRLLFFIMLKYSEDFFYSPQIPDIEKNVEIVEAASTTTTILYDNDENEDSKIKKCIQEYDLNNYKNIPNILSKKYCENLG